MFITQPNEIINLMPTARWDRPEQLFGYLDEEERVALEPLLGTPLYMHLCDEYIRLTQLYVDITATTIRANGQAKTDPKVAYADITERLDQLQAGTFERQYTGAEEGNTDVPKADMATIRLIRICQQIEFYKMLSHKSGLLTVSFNEGGGMNMVSADGYEPADDKRMERVVKDAYMSAGRAIDSLLLFLEADAKGDKQFTDKWKEADAFYLHKDLLFQTARVLNEYLDIKGERMAYISLVRDIRFCQNTYLKPSIGTKLLQAVIAFANNGSTASESSSSDDAEITTSRYNDVVPELLSLLRTALAFYIESRRTALGPKEEKLARRDSMIDAQQAMAAACDYIEENLDALGEAAVDSPIYRRVQAQKKQMEAYKANAEAAAARERQERHDQNRRKLFTAFPVTHRTPELK